MFICECPGPFDEVRGTHMFSQLATGYITTLKAPTGSEAVHTETVRFALVLPESKPFYFFGGGNILDSL